MTDTFESHLARILEHDRTTDLRLWLLDGNRRPGNYGLDIDRFLESGERFVSGRPDAGSVMWELVDRAAGEARQACISDRLRGATA
jgi:hypothetical protein